MWILTLIGLFISGCTYTSERLHPRFTDYRKPMKVMLVLVPEIAIFEHIPDGGTMFQAVQSRQAQRIALQQVVRQLEMKRFRVQTADAETMGKDDLPGITSLFRSVNRSIQLHTFGSQAFPSKLDAFEYNMGSVDALLKKIGADGLILTIGHQTGGAGHIAGNWLSIAVVEPEGRIIWYGLQGGDPKFNLSNANGIAALVDYTMANFWEQGS